MRRSAAIWTVKFAFSTTVRPQTAAMISSFNTRVPARSTSTARTSRGSRTNRYGNKDAALIAPRKPLALPIEAKFLEQENVPGGEHAPVSRLSRGRRPHPLGLVESLSDGLRAALLRRFRGICRFLAIFLFPFSRPTRPALGTLGDARMPKEEHAVCEGR